MGPVLIPPITLSMLTFLGKANGVIRCRAKERLSMQSFRSRVLLPPLAAVPIFVGKGIVLSSASRITSAEGSIFQVLRSRGLLGGVSLTLATGHEKDALDDNVIYGLKRNMSNVIQKYNKLMN